MNRQRSESALMSVIQECWINGISTRKMERVFKSFGIEDISAGQVSQVTKELDEEIAQFRNSTLSSFYPVVWIDALYEKIREDRKVSSKAIMVAMAIYSAMAYKTRKTKSSYPMNIKKTYKITS